MQLDNKGLDYNAKFQDVIYFYKNASVGFGRESNDLYIDMEIPLLQKIHPKRDY